MKEYGILMAQVIPVILLAFLLELRAILEASRAERVEFSQKGLATKEAVLLTGWRIRIARMLRIPYPQPTNIDPEVALDDGTKPELVELENSPLHNRMSGIDAFGFVWIYGFVMLLLVRAEAVSLTLAQTGTIPVYEIQYINATVVLSLSFLIIVAVGLEIYRNFGGSKWPKSVFTAFGVAGLTITFIFFASLIPLLDSMLG